MYVYVYVYQCVCVWVGGVCVCVCVFVCVCIYIYIYILSICTDIDKDWSDREREREGVIHQLLGPLYKSRPPEALKGQPLWVSPEARMLTPYKPQKDPSAGKHASPI